MGRELSRHKEFSDQTAAQIDLAVRKILDEAKKRAMDILSEHKDQLDRLAQELFEKETLDDAEIQAFLGITPVAEQ